MTGIFYFVKAGLSGFALVDKIDKGQIKKMVCTC
jgi:hypothetical protein